MNQATVAMGYKVVELGPFGSKINKGEAENLADLPEGYSAKKIVANPKSTTVYIEPSSEGS